MAHDDWRLRIELEEEGHAADFLAQLGLDLGSDASELAKELAERRLVVSNDADSVFVYTATSQEAQRARAVVESELKELRIEPREVSVERWLEEDDRWSDEPRAPDPDEELLQEGYAPWEVRIECESRAAAHALADRLEQEGYGVVRRFHGEVEPGGELVYEVTPQNPFAIFGGLGG